MILGIVASASNSGAAGGVGDAFFNQVVASLHFDGADASTTFTDVKGHAFAAAGAAQLDTAQSRFGGASLLLDGTDDYISAPDSADWAFGAGDWTVDLWVRFNGDPGTATMTFVSHYNTTGNQRGWAIGLDNNTLRLLYSTNGSSDATAISVAWNPATAIWYYVSVVRFGPNIYFFVNGALLGIGSIGATTAIFDSSASLQIGTQSLGATGDMNGWIDDVRITRAARYTKSFGRPVRAHYDSLGVPGDERYALAQSILHLDDDFTDGKGVTWTPAGNTFIDTSQKVFGNASARLDGTGDWIDATDADFAWGTGDFTLECWVRNSVLSGNNFVFTFGGGWGVYSFSGSWAVFDGAATNVIGPSGSVAVDLWYHVALCRRGTSMRLFVNGVQVGGTATNSTNFSSTSIRLGAQPAGIGTLNGWIQDFRASSFARYVGDFQPPMRPHPDVVGDPFFDNVIALNHWNGTNGSTTYVDQIAGRTWANGAGAIALQTADFKFGPSSVKFPGTSGNLLDSNSTSDLAYGLEDFTIEMWFKIATVGTTMLWDQRTGLSQPRACIFQQSGSLLYFVNGGTAITGTSLTNATWQHVALSRRAGSTRLFIAGVQVGSTYTDAIDYTEGRIRLGTAGDTPGFGTHDGAYDDIRVTRGTGRYVSNFSPPPIPFGDAA